MYLPNYYKTNKRNGSSFLGEEDSFQQQGKSKPSWAQDFAAPAPSPLLLLRRLGRCGHIPLSQMREASLQEVGRLAKVTQQMCVGWGE